MGVPPKHGKIVAPVGLSNLAIYSLTDKKGRMLTEADTATRLIVPRLRSAGWDDAPHSFAQEHCFTDGRIVLIGTKVRRKQKKRADFLLQYTRDFTIAVVEAKSEDRPAGEGRILLTMATGTGKTVVAFNIAWKLWESRWNRTGEYRKPKILFLADRNVLVDDPMAKTFAAFGDARFKIENGKINKGREMFFAIYQAIAKDANRPGLYKEYPADFFDLIIIDECHRGSANDESSWREILEYFEPAFQIGMTATPKRQDNVDTYQYFGNSIYTYSLRQGIDDGFLAPYRVHRIITSVDAAGWRPTAGDIDRYGREIPDDEYQTKSAKEKVRTLYTSADDLRGKWSDPQQRKLIIDQLDERGIDFDELASASGHPEGDPFDLLCHIAFNAPLKTRRERAEKLRKDKKDLFDQFGPKARDVPTLLLEKYEQHGTAQFVLPDVLQLPPINGFGNVMEIAELFGGADQLRNVVNEIQAGLYAA